MFYSVPHIVPVFIILNFIFIHNSYMYLSFNLTVMYCTEELTNCYIFRKLSSSQPLSVLSRRFPWVRDKIEPEGEPRYRFPQTKSFIELRRISKESFKFCRSTGSDREKTSGFAQVFGESVYADFRRNVNKTSAIWELLLEITFSIFLIRRSIFFI